jgi:secondary thiamine-phosphate synthase enzyme
VPVFQKEIRLATRGRCDVVDITRDVAGIVAASGIETGVVNVSGVGSTLGITTLEFEPGCVADLKRALDQIAPPNPHYAHNARWGDQNGYAHLRSALVGTARSYPVASGKIAIGTWQQIVLCDFDDRSRQREVVVTVVGEQSRM